VGYYFLLDCFDLIFHQRIDGFTQINGIDGKNEGKTLDNERV